MSSIRRPTGSSVRDERSKLACKALPEGTPRELKVRLAEGGTFAKSIEIERAAYERAIEERDADERLGLVRGRPGTVCTRGSR